MPCIHMCMYQLQYGHILSSHLYRSMLSSFHAVYTEYIYTPSISRSVSQPVSDEAESLLALSSSSSSKFLSVVNAENEPSASCEPMSESMVLLSGSIIDAFSSSSMAAVAVADLRDVYNHGYW